ncbi:splicing factor U2AF 26 kDa subunit isoform X14 [Pan paniscus]|uniref:splicing factor U2AF 26 kDa subunit isoform X14 n=1 Tax=Pan paniscus TaxID=9597 RepID=UPI00243652D8|nr:splicing factor U2AF 26 kDa subunit isoform X14 [Pan paniscus]
MAEYLASIFGTEKDKVNCSFYFKIGVCRHGDRCSRLHNKPTFSQFRREEDGERAVAELNNRWFNGQAVHGNVPEVASATSCICGPFPRTSRGSSMGGDPGTGRPRGSILATIPERGTIGVPLITGMAASEALDPLPFTPNRDRCSWQDLSSKPPSLSCPILPRLPCAIM